MRGFVAFSSTTATTQLHSITLHYTSLHYTTFHYTTLHYTALHYTTLHYIPLRYTTLHYSTLHDTTLQLHYSTFPSQNVQNTPGADHFWQLRCRKSARRCGAKHISKSKSTKHTRCGPLLAVEMLKKCMPLWRKAHFQVKMHKAHHGRSTFGS